MKINSWLKQTDTNSCGYYLIHNIHLFVTLKDYEGSPQQVFQKINTIRRENSERILERTEYLPTNDLNKYFLKKGFKVQNYSNTNSDFDEIEKILKNKMFELIYLTSNSHYTGIVKQNQHFLFLDSFQDSAVAINLETAIQKVQDSLGSTNGRQNIVGVIQKKNFRIHI